MGPIRGLNHKFLGATNLIKKGGLLMKIVKLVGCAGLVSAALIFSSTSLTLAESSLDRTVNFSGERGDFAHRVSHALASQEQYAVEFKSSYVWGPKSTSSTSVKKVIPEQSVGRSGYKWNQTDSFDQAGSRWGRTSGYEQAGSRWGRTSGYEQAGSRWGRN